MAITSTGVENNYLCKNHVELVPVMKSHNDMGENPHIVQLINTEGWIFNLMLALLMVGQECCQRLPTEPSGIMQLLRIRNTSSVHT